MGYRCHRRRYRNSNTLGAVSNNNNCNGTLGENVRCNCNGTLGENVQCHCRRNYPSAGALEDAYNQGYKDGYCAGVEAGREEGYCQGYQEGAQEGCQDAKEAAVRCINSIRCN
ncbi:hypothetical protein C1H57_01880 [Clostridium sp. 2-1]|uniref:Flagellar assembly protein H n=2 Tax=Clostridium TaxID=1485 RepID=A0AAX0AUE2_CLOBE|nr:MULTISPECIES: hypothetical protein [Clostridium]MBN7573619.1 hypothetical protein [Clostridium beijerinckii]MBN7578967.1 hypothetical protein [Clostridium beijerinckii]MBN7583250.1 hypothetical protein [Clostridium beijerinckii]MBO0521272.1 hypothetical protein [Clostridium beijerinckii]NRT86593.1 hypothetical protein [Clostridium beijerinckii]